jgi:lipopolysaccharide export system protein LptA
MNLRAPLPPMPRLPTPAQRPGSILLLGISLCLGCATAVALESDREQPVYIEADSVELDDLQDTSVYTGNVQIDQGSMRILADQVTVKHKEDRHPRFIVAVGNPVRYKQDVEDNKGEVRAHAQRMEYDADKDELTLIDQAELTQASDRFASDRIVYDRARSQVKAGTSAQGSGRVRITFTPEKEAEAKSNGGARKPTGEPSGRARGKPKARP